MIRRACLTTVFLCSLAWGQIEPNAGAWKTWVIASGSQFRLPPPPGAAATEDEAAWLRTLSNGRSAYDRGQVQYWNAGAPGYRWVEIANAEIVRNGTNNVRGARALALVNVAIYDAMVAAWDSKYTYNRARPAGVDALIPNPLSPSYPSEHAVAAGAASAILSYLYPAGAQRYAELAEEAARSRLFAGVEYPTDTIAGLELGRKVAAAVIELARTDRSDVPWTGTVPAEPGKWRGTNPVEPAGGTWKTWVLSSGSQLRSPPPPAFDSALMAAELAEVKAFPRTVATNFAAYFWNSAAAFKIYGDILNQKLFEYRLDTNAPRAARAHALISIANYDANVGCWDAKYTYWSIRPAQLDASVTTVFPTPNHPSYPSAHACNDGAIAGVLSYLFPADASFFAGRAIEAAESRLWAGIHFRADLTAGSALGAGVARLVIDRARADGSE